MRRLEEHMTRFVCVTAGIALGAGSAMAVSFATATPIQDAVQLSPQYYTLKLENDRVRVLEFRFKPGDKEPTHAHIPYVVYFLSSGTIRTVAPGGMPVISSVTQGDVSYRDALSHTTENIGQTEVHALIVELKAAGR
jgi:hypothetical protein